LLKINANLLTLQALMGADSAKVKRYMYIP